MNISYVKSNKIPLLILGVTSLLSSSVLFRLFNDPEGPNLLIVVGAAVIMYLVSLVAYAIISPTTSLKKILFVILMPILIATGFYLGLN